MQPPQSFSSLTQLLVRVEDWTRVGPLQILVGGIEWAINFRLYFASHDKVEHTKLLELVYTLV